MPKAVGNGVSACLFIVVHRNPVPMIASRHKGTQGTCNDVMYLKRMRNKKCSIFARANVQKPVLRVYPMTNDQSSM